MRKRERYFCQMSEYYSIHREYQMAGHGIFWVRDKRHTSGRDDRNA